MTDKIKNLYNLNELPNYKVADDYIDVRGWEVKDKNNRTIGVVNHLLVNKRAQRVVYLDVEVNAALIEKGHETYQIPANEGLHEFLNEDGEDHLIIPIGLAFIDDENKVVTTNEIGSSIFNQAKRFKKGHPIDFDYELDLVRHYTGDKTIDRPNSPDEFYNREEFRYDK